MHTLGLPRAMSGGSLNFVVGVNGSGKSTILRVLYQAFRALRHRQWPELPLTLAWDSGLPWEDVAGAWNDGPYRLLHWDPRGESHSFLIVMPRTPEFEQLDSAGWHQKIETWSNYLAWRPTPGFAQVSGNAVLGHPQLDAALPKQVLAYTSGNEELWQHLDRNQLQAEALEAPIETEAERPAQWSLRQEWHDELPQRLVRNLGSGDQTKLNDVDLAEINRLRKQLATQPAAIANREFDLRVGPQQARIAAIVTALWQAAEDQRTHPDAAALDGLRQHAKNHPDGDDARMVLNRIDWLLPSHLCLTYHDHGDGLLEDDRRMLLALVALADEVIALPRGRMRAVIALKHRSNLSIAGAINPNFLVVPQALESLVKRLDQEPSGASAFLRIFSESQDLHACLFDAFSTLHRWQRLGLLEHLGLTITRIHQTTAISDELEDRVVSYDQLSDGEQMLLCRMALPFLLRGQDGALLLLDEPETHFNDVWKRELVTMLDRALLDTTRAQVVMATHTSIALSDALAAEVTVFNKDLQTGRISAEGIPHALFGVDPSRLLLKVFDAPDITGSRSAQLLRKLLDPNRWKPDEKADLEHLIGLIGSGWPRARLMDILEELEGNRAPSDP
ncbi:hypothetical protein LBMAG53_39640 [Planctomycetota bacterium]|nr:hypothetical protein LBMAG53_39640 [Planctomycetota bacterium]